MDEQSRQLFSQRVPTSTSLTQSCLGGDHHIPQNLWVEVGKRPFTHSKGQHIGGTIDTAIAGVQPAHSGIVDDEYTQITALTCEGREQSQQRLSERPGVDRDDLLLIPTADGH
jgi:hypothetical protein